jgi:hypothetical protein
MKYQRILLWAAPILLSGLSAYAADDWKLFVPSKSSACKGEGKGFEIKKDFDGNGKQDVARLEDNSKTRHRRIAVWMNGATAPTILDDRPYETASDYLTIQDPTTVIPYEESDSAKKPTPVKIAHPSIAFGSCESSGAVYYFDDKTKAFKLVWISD